jgi:hypothetical protein
VFYLALGKQASLPSVFFLALGKQASLPSVFLGTWQRNKKISSPNLKTFSNHHIQHLVLHVKIWYIF